MIELRDATADDAAAITVIRNALLATTTIEWTERERTDDETREWLAARAERCHPVIVAVDGDEVVGWASYSDFRDSVARPGYRFTVEHSVHVVESHWRQGIARQLMDALVDHARVAGKHVMVAAIDGSNVDSIRFHERLGFTEVGRMPEVGEKFGRWHDLVLMQRFVD